MEIKIKEHHLKEAKSIIETNLRTQSSIKTLLDSIDKSKDTLTYWKNDLEQLREAKMSDDLKEEELNKLFSRYDIEIARLQKDLNPLLLEMEELKKRSNVLYAVLKEEWPNLSDEQLKEHLYKGLQSI